LGRDPGQGVRIGHVGFLRRQRWTSAGRLGPGTASGHPVRPQRRPAFASRPAAHLPSRGPAPERAATRMRPP
jgi:hypothetical protein